VLPSSTARWLSPAAADRSDRATRHGHQAACALLQRIETGEIDPRCVIIHRLSLDEAATGFDLFVNKEDECLKVVLKP
jgi:threonine dehydrogenase-like Zn-dependent dehydrogenase